MVDTRHHARVTFNSDLHVRRNGGIKDLFPVFDVGDVVGLGIEFSGRAADTEIVVSKVPLKPGSVTSLVSIAPVHLHVEQLPGVVDWPSRVADDSPLTTALFEEVDAARLRGLLLAVGLSDGDVAVSNGCSVSRAGDDVVIRGSLGCGLRVSAAALSGPDSVLYCLRFCDRSGHARVHVVVGIDVLQVSFVTALTSFTPCFIEGYEFLLVGFAALAYSADGCEKNCQSKQKYSGQFLGSFPYEREDLAARYGDALLSRDLKTDQQELLEGDISQKRAGLYGILDVVSTS